MSFEIVTIPCLSDNYAFLIVENGKAAVVDVPEAAPIVAEVRARGMEVTDVILTHHHDDHIQGLAALQSDLGGDIRVIGGKADAHRLPPLSLEVEDGDRFELFGAEVQVMDVSGHTIGHLAYYIEAAKTEQLPHFGKR